MTTEKQIKANKKSKDGKDLVKKEGVALEKMTDKEAKDWICRIGRMEGDPALIMDKLNKLREDLHSKRESGKDTEQDKEKLSEAAVKAFMVYGLDTHYPLAETVSENYRPLAIEFSRQLIQEFDCKTVSEKALAQIVVNAYIRVIDNSRRFNNCLEAAQYLSDEKTKYLSVISKQLDRANRQFITALTTLKQIKMPSLEINVKAKAAFVAQNQQLNINPSNKDNTNKNENVEPK